MLFCLYGAGSLRFASTSLFPHCCCFWSLFVGRCFQFSMALENSTEKCKSAYLNGRDRPWKYHNTIFSRLLLMVWVWVWVWVCGCAFRRLPNIFGVSKTKFYSNERWNTSVQMMQITEQKYINPMWSAFSTWSGLFVFLFVSQFHQFDFRRQTQPATSLSSFAASRCYLRRDRRRRHHAVTVQTCSIARTWMRWIVLSSPTTSYRPPPLQHSSHHFYPIYILTRYVHCMHDALTNCAWVIASMVEHVVIYVWSRV